MSECIMSPDRKKTLFNNTNNHSIKEKIIPKIQVGRKFQAICPPCGETNDETKIFEQVRWSPEHNISDQQLDSYIQQADKCGCGKENAYDLLRDNGYNILQALKMLKGYKTNKSAVWSKDERKQFQQNFLTYGKDFQKIKQAMPLKTRADLVEFYYLWKNSKISRKCPKYKSRC